MISSLLFKILPLALSMAFLPVTAAGMREPVHYQVSPWGVPEYGSDGYPTLDGVKPGDIVSFHWTSTGYGSGSDYNVYLYPTTSCADETNKVWVGSTSGSTYEIREWDQGKSLHFACDKDDFCERGMSIVINVSACPPPAPTGSWGKTPTEWPTEWKAPPTEYPTRSPTPWPTRDITDQPTKIRTESPTYEPTYANTPPPTWSPTKEYIEDAGSSYPTGYRENAPTEWPTEWKAAPIEYPTKFPTAWPATYQPTNNAQTYPPTAEGVTEPPSWFPTQEFVENDFVDNPEPKEIVIENWDIPADALPFPPIEANVGDTITWVIPPGHDVWNHPSMSCDTTGAIFVGDNTVGGSYTFQAEDGSEEGKDHLFVCEVGGGTHCNLGMQMLVTVFVPQQQQPELDEPQTSAPTSSSQTSAPTVSTQQPEPIEGGVEDNNDEPPATQNLNLEWEVTGEPFETVDMNVGDSITFTMLGGHNVYIHPTLDCDQTGRVLVAEETVTYTFTDDDGSPDGKPMFFACDIGSHCSLGMQILVNVFSTESNSGSSPENPPPSTFGEADRISGREIFVDNWVVPEDNRAFDPIEAVVGDTLIFSWPEGENQNVYRHPSLTCDRTLAVFVGAKSPTAYTFQASDGSPDGKDHLFVSDVDTNCALGTQLLVKVFSAPDVTADAGTSNTAIGASAVPASSSKVFATTVLSMASVLIASALIVLV